MPIPTNCAVCGAPTTERQFGLCSATCKARSDSYRNKYRAESGLPPLSTEPLPGDGQATVKVVIPDIDIDIKQPAPRRVRRTIIRDPKTNAITGMLDEEV